MKYKAFISYKHSTEGRTHAISIEKGLKQYARPILSPPMKIFRDEKRLSLGDDLPKSIKKGLANSEYLIFLASQESANSLWCQEELMYWCKELKRVENLIIVWIGDDIECDLYSKKINWKKTNAIPNTISDQLNYIPIFIDLRWGVEEKLNIQNSRYKDVINRITAKLRGITPEFLMDEEFKIYRKNKRIRNLVISVLSIMLLISIATTFYASHQTNVANENFKEAELQKDVANKNFKEAEFQKEIANKNFKEAEFQKEIAQEQKEIAQVQERIANEQRDSAEIERKNALLQRDTAIQRQKQLLIKNKELISKTYAIKARQEYGLNDYTKAIRYAELSLDNQPTTEGVQILKDIASDPNPIYYNKKLGGYIYDFISQTFFDANRGVILYNYYNSNHIIFSSIKDSIIRSHKFHEGHIKDFHINTKGDKIGVIHNNGFSSIWSYPDLQLLKTMENKWEDVYSYNARNIAISNGGEKAILSNNDSLLIIDIAKDSIIDVKDLNYHNIVDILTLKNIESFLLVLIDEIIEIDSVGNYVGKIKTIEKGGDIVALSSSDRYIAAASYEAQEVKIFDRFDPLAETFFSITLPFDYGGVKSMSFSPDEQKIVITPKEASPLVWEFSTSGEVTNLFHSNYNESITSAFLSNNEVFVQYPAYGLTFDLSKNLKFSSQKFLDKKITCYTHSSHDSYIAVGYENNEVFILSNNFEPLDTLSFAGGINSMDTNRLQKMLLIGEARNQKEGVTSIIYSPNENYIVLEFFHRYAFLWNAKNGKFLKGFHYESVKTRSRSSNTEFENRIHFSHDETLIFIQTSPKSCEIYSPSNQNSQTIHLNEEFTNFFLNSDQYLLFWNKKKLELFQNNGKHISSFEINTIDNVFEVSPDELIICSRDEGFFKLDLNKSKLSLLKKIKSQSHTNSIYINSRGKIYFKESNLNVSSFDIKSKKEEFCFELPNYNFEIKKFDDNAIIAFDKTNVELYNLEKKIKTFKINHSTPNKIIPLPLSQHLVISCHDDYSSQISVLDSEGNILQNLKNSFILTNSRKPIDDSEKNILFIMDHPDINIDNTGVLNKQSLLRDILSKERVLTQESIPNFEYLKIEK